MIQFNIKIINLTKKKLLTYLEYVPIEQRKFVLYAVPLRVQVFIFVVEVIFAGLYSLHLISQV